MGTLRCTISHSGRVVNGVTLGDPVAPAWYTYDDPRIPNGQINDDGSITEYDTVADDPAAASNRETLRTQAAQAMAANRAAIAATAPSNAQIVAHVKALSAQNNALIRLVLGLLDATD